MLNGIKLYKKVVSKKDVYDVIKNKGNISLCIDNSKVISYKSLNQDLKNKIYGQDISIDKLTNYLVQKELLSKNECLSIYISGSKLSGKRYFANKVAESIIDKKNIIRIDGTEYFDYHMLSKLIGTTPGYLGYDNKDNIFERIKDNPNSLILIDSFDEGCIEFKNIFKRILEYNYIEDAKGEKIDFSNSTIIFIEENKNMHNNMGFNNQISNEEISGELKNISLKLKLSKLDEKTIKNIIKTKIDIIVNKYSNISIIYTNNLVDEIYEKMDKNLTNIDLLIEKKLESKIADAIINNEKTVKINEESLV